MLEENNNIDNLFSDKLYDYQEDVPNLNFEEIQIKLSDVVPNNEIDELFSDKLYDYQEDVPNYVFENIQDKINKNIGNNNIDNLFSEYLGNYQKEPPSYVLPEIKNKLKKKKTKEFSFKMQKIAATIAILIAFGLGYFSSEVNDNNFKAKNIFYKNIFKFKNDTTKKIKNIKNKKIIANNKSKDSIKKIDSSNIEIPKASFVKKNSYYDNSLLSELSDFTKRFFISRTDNKIDSTKKTENKSTENNKLLKEPLLIANGNFYDEDFLSTNTKSKKSRWTFGTKVSPVFSFSNKNSNTITAENNLNIVGNNVNNVNNNNQPVTATEPSSEISPPISAANQSDAQPEALSAQPPSTTKTAIVVNEQPDVKFNEQAITTFTSGLNVNFKISKRWSVQSGLYYSKRKQISKDLTSSSSFSNENQISVFTPVGNKIIDKPIENINDIENEDIILRNREEIFYSSDMDYVSNFKYIELPIVFKFKIIDRKIDLELLSGISTNFLVGNNASIMIEEKELWKGVNEDISPLLYDATFGFGLNYNFYKNFNFSLEPTFKYNIVKQNANIQNYPYSFAVFAGFSYTF